MEWVLLKHIRSMSHYIDKFSEVKRNELWIGRCPVCGDSQKDENKRRFFIYKLNDNFNVKCHNCNYSHSFYIFTKEYYEEIFKELKYELFKEKSGSRSMISNIQKSKIDLTKIKSKTPVFEQVKVKSDLLNDFPTMEDLPNDHVCKQYVLDRKLPKQYLSELRYTDDFRQVAFKLGLDELANKMFKGDKRLILPFFDQDGQIYAVQGRTLTGSSLKYITLKVDPNNDKFYGLDRLDKTKPIIVLEGGFDSMFLPNSVAVCDADLGKFKEGDYYVFDNQPRNKELCKIIEKAINNDLPVTLLPTHLSKDINDMIKDGVTSDTIVDIIRNNTYKGLNAKIKFSKWRKC